MWYSPYLFLLYLYIYCLLCVTFNFSALALSLVLSRLLMVVGLEEYYDHLEKDSYRFLPCYLVGLRQPEETTSLCRVVLCLLLESFTCGRVVAT